MDALSPAEKYAELIQEIVNRFQQSEIRKKQKSGENEWNYALCATPIKPNEGLILGINWGADKKECYAVSGEMPKGDDISGYSFIKRSREYLNKSLGVNVDQPNFNYSNFCFFRSPEAKDLAWSDYDLCWDILVDYINYIKPPWILSLGVTIVDVLPKIKNARDYHLSKVDIGHSAVLGYRGDLLGYDFYVLPHPNYRLKKELRNAIWKNIFPGKF